MPRPLYCPDPPTGRNAHYFSAPPPYGRHHPRIRDLAIDYAVRYGRLDRAALMKACADPSLFMALYDATDDPTVHRAIYCVELGNRPQFTFAIEQQINELLLSARARPRAGQNRVWYPHMRDQKWLSEEDNIWRRVAYWEACEPERVMGLPPAPEQLVLKSNHVLPWGEVFQNEQGKWQVVGFEAVFDCYTAARLMWLNLKLYLWNEPHMVPLHQTILATVANRNAVEGDAP